MLVYTPEEAKLQSCCMMDKKCEAVGCMAWTSHWIVDPDRPVQVPRSTYAPPPPPNMKPSGKGYCGLIREQ